MKSAVMVGKVRHARTAPKKHVFTYPTIFFAIDLNDLSYFKKENMSFGYNQFAQWSISDHDYLYGSGSIQEKLMRILKEKGITTVFDSIVLITNPRFFGIVFNPASFYYCYLGGKLEIVVAEVNNTFGERHLYILNKLKPRNNRLIASSQKAFHVSPFFQRTGHYEFEFSDLTDSLYIEVNLKQGDDIVLFSSISGPVKALSKQVMKSISWNLRTGIWMTLPRIHWQATRLFFQRKLRTFSKPVPASDDTVQTRQPSVVERVCMRIVTNAFRRIEVGQLRVRWPSGQETIYGDRGRGALCDLVVRDYRFFKRLVLHQGVGLGESYVAGEWGSINPSGVLELFIKNKDSLSEKKKIYHHISDFKNRITHLRRKNSVNKSEGNIQAHYDFGNQFFEVFLDPTMMYSCAFYKTGKETLTEAQKNKIGMILDKADIQPMHEVLEIGSGWGAIAIEMAKRYQCRVTSITLSKEQQKLAQERVSQEGLQDYVDIQLCDYRNLTGKFDRIVSVEMIEAVGHEYLHEFFRICDQVLKPQGRIVLQVITIPDQHYERYRKSCDWIQKHIFPGGHLPSIEILKKATRKASSLAIKHVENIGPHYAKTLNEWRSRFLASADKISSLGYSHEIQRKWDFYFSYCEAAFRTQYLDNLQLVLAR